MREFSVPALVAIPDTANVTDPLWQNADQRPNVVQFVVPGRDGWRDVTCAQFRDDVIALARGIISAGVAPGERVALMCQTRYEWTLIDYAIWAAGAVTVPIYETSSPEQVQWILFDSGSVAAFVETPAHAERVHGVRDRTPDLREVWQIEPGDGRAGAIAELVKAGEAVEPSEVERRRALTRAEDLATIIYTSGTTGRPKGCALSHRNLYFDVANSVPGMAGFFNEQAVTLLFLPLAHSFARLIQMGAVYVRATTAFTADVKNLAEHMKFHRPTFVLAVPRVFEKVYNTAKQRAHAEGHGSIFDRAERTAIEYSQALDTRSGPSFLLRARHRLYDRLVYGKLREAMGGRLEAAVSGGAPLGARLGHFFRGIGLTVYEGYGLTETSPAVSCNLEHAIRIGTVGRPIPGVTVRINDDGEVAVRSDVVFQGYWHNPDATADAMQDDWFLTGDLGELDDDGFLSITGRKKEMIVTAGGKNVAPAVLEDRIRAHALISQCMVVGDRQPFVAALVTLDEEALPAWKAEHHKPAAMSLADLRHDPDLLAEIQGAVNEANKAVSQAESIRVFRILAGDFTEANGMLTPSLKVKRTVVSKEYADEIATIYR